MSDKKPKVELPEVSELFALIKAMLPDAAGFEGVIVRSVAVKFAQKEDFFSGVGAAIAGGRWNPVGIKSTYACLDVETATREAYQSIVDYGFPMTSIRPRVMAGAMVSLQKVIDLTKEETCHALGFEREDLLEEEWKAIQMSGRESWSQAIGRGAYLAKFEALIVPSARNEVGKNVVLFPGRLKKGSKINILGEDELPQA